MLDDGAEAYKWVKYVYIDDPISSLDEHNAIAVANHLAQMLPRGASAAEDGRLDPPPAVLQRAVQRAAERRRVAVLPQPRRAAGDGYLLASRPATRRSSTTSPRWSSSDEAAQIGQSYTRTTSTCCARFWRRPPAFLGYDNFSECIKTRRQTTRTASCTQRLINLLSHGDYSLYEPQEMLDENKRYFRKILHELHRAPTRSTRALFPSEPAPQMT